MPVDAPPPYVPPPPTANGPPPQDPTMVDALGGMAGMGPQGLDMVSGIRTINELVIKLVSQAQAQGDPQTAMALADVMNTLTGIAQQQLQGPMAGPMAGNGLGAPPLPGPLPGNQPGMAGPTGPPPLMPPG